MRLIDADALEPHEVYFNYGCQRIVYMDDIDEMPTIVAEPVIRCKDCKYNCVTSYNHGVQDEPRCKFTSYKLSLNDYCSRGEKMEQE